MHGRIIFHFFGKEQENIKHTRHPSLLLLILLEITTTMNKSSLNPPAAADDSTIFTPRDIVTIEILIPPRLPDTDIISQSSVENISSSKVKSSSKLCNDTTSTCSVISINHDNKTDTLQVLNAATREHNLKTTSTDIIVDEKVDKPSRIISSETTSIAITSSRADSYLQDSSDTLTSCVDENIVFTAQLNDVANMTHARCFTRKDYYTKRGANNPFCPRKSELHCLAVANYFFEDLDDNEEMDEDY